MGVKTINQIINEKSSQETTMQEQKIGTNKEPINPNEYTNRLNIETYHYDEREYLKGKYYNLSTIEPDLHKKTFDNAKTLNDKEKAHKESFQRYCNNFGELSKKGLGILLMGKKGTGKSYYADCIFNELSPKYVVYRSTLSFVFQRFKNTYNPNSKITIIDLIKELKECDLIILDDVGSENISEEWGEENIYNLINFLTTNNVSIIMTSNLSTNDLRNHLSVKKDDKIIDRIREKCKLFIFDWESRRGDTFKKEFEELYWCTMY